MKALGFILIFAVFLGCGAVKDGTESTGVAVTLRGARLVGGASVDVVYTLMLTVSAPDIVTIAKSFEIREKTTLDCVVDVPNGFNRRFSAELFDAYGNLLYTGEAYADLSGMTVTVTIDLEPMDTDAPSTPAALAVSGASYAGVELSWSASTDNVRVEGYRVYRDGVHAASTDSTSFSDSGLSPSVRYCYQVAAYDGNDNLSPLSDTVCANTPSFMAVMAWGSNDKGQLGDGTRADYRDAPVYVSGITNAITVAAGGSHSLALKLDGTVWAWGDNGYGQLGDGTTEQRNVPVQVVGLSNVTAVAAGLYHSLALKLDGTVWAWGDNYYGQLGDDTTERRNVPVQVVGLSNVTAVAAGSYHSLAVIFDTTVRAWGLNGTGQLGDGTTGQSNVPVQAVGLSGVTRIAAGERHSLALKSDGMIWTWGDNSYGQLGIGNTENKSSPVQLTNLLTKMSAIAAGFAHNLAISSLADGGSLWTWGYNNAGQLGDGTFENRLAPSSDSLANPNGLIAAEGGFFHSLDLSSGGRVFAGGDNSYGQLGDGTIRDAVAIAAGDWHNLAVVLIDNFPPSTPPGLSVSSSAELSWSPSTDDIKVNGYKVYNGDNNYGSPIADVTGTSYTDTAARTSYCYKVSAYDLRRRESAMSAEVCR